MKFLSFVILGLSLMAAPIAHAAIYTVDHGASSVAFSGTHAGTPFKGRFNAWQATIVFDPAALADSRITATLQADSATTGNPMYDGTLPQADWLNVKAFPTIEFASTTITQNADKSYTAAGTLTIRGITQPANLTFTVSDVTQTPVTATGTVTVDRLGFEIGKKSDGKAEWVSKDITLEIKITATLRKFH